MKALILAAGKGSRLKELTHDRPKGMVEFCGMSLVQRSVNNLKLLGLSDIGIVTGFKEEAFDFLNLNHFQNNMWETTNMVRSLMVAEEWLTQDDCIISYSDIFYSPEWLSRLIKSEKEITITYDTDWQELWKYRFDNPLDDAESFKIDNQMRILEIGNKVNDINDIQGQYMGLLKFTPDGWSNVFHILKSLEDDELDRISITEVLQYAISNNVSVHGVPISGQWGEIDHPSDLSLYTKLQADGYFGDWLKCDNA